MRRNSTDRDNAGEPNSLSQLQMRYSNLCKAAGLTPFQRLLHTIDDDSVELKGQRIGDIEAVTCFTALQCCVNLRSLHLESNALGNSGASQVALFLSETVCLTELRIKDNEIGAKGLESITNALLRNSTIRVLDLSGNQLDYRCGKFIRRLLERNENLVELILTNNQFDSAGTVDIAYGLAHNRRLTQLDLSWNQVRADGAICLCDSLAVNQELETLLLANNGLGIQGCKSLAKSLTKNDCLQFLDLTSNRIDARCLEYILKGLTGNASLKCLKLSQNPLPVDVINAFMGQLEKKTQMELQSLDLTGLTVDRDTLRLANSIGAQRSFSLLHGPVLRSEGNKVDDEISELNDDPMTLLMEFMRIKNLRLMDFFMSLDTSNTKAVPCKKFKQGLVNLGLPASPQCLQSIVLIMDRDGDGQIDITEVMGSIRSHRRKMHRVQAMEKKLPYAETLAGRVSQKLELALEQQRKRQAALKERLQTAVVSKQANS